MHSYDSGETFDKNTTYNKLEGIKMHLVNLCQWTSKFWGQILGGVDFYYLMYKVLQEKMSSVCKHN